MSSLSDYPASLEFREALADCQSELKMAKLIGDFPKFLKVADEIFLLFKSEKELHDELDDIIGDERIAMVKANINNASAIEKTDIQLDYSYRKRTILNRILEKQKAGKQRLEYLYVVYKEEILNK